MRLETPSLAGAAYDALRRGIYDGTYAPGSFIRISQFAASLEISITPVREAMARAAAERLLVLDPNHGFTVARKLSADEYDWLFAVRLLLEEEGVASLEDAPAVAEALQPFADQMSSYTGGTSMDEFFEFEAADQAFHRTLVGTGNPFLLIAYDSLHFHLHVSRLYGAGGILDAPLALGEHQAIIDALTRGDVAEARAALVAHVRGSEQRLRLLLLPPAESFGENA